MQNAWDVGLTRKVEKQIKALPESIRIKTKALMDDLLEKGYMQPSWPGFSTLSRINMTFHCHIKNGKPTYVACWQVINKQSKKIEVYYVGTHENAPY